MNCLDDGTDEKYYKNMNRNILDGNVMNMSLTIIELIFDAIDKWWLFMSCLLYHQVLWICIYPSSRLQYWLISYFIRRFCLWEDLFFSINNNYHYYVLQENKSINTIVYLRKIINGNVNVLFYDCNYVVPQCLRSIP